MYKVIIVDDEPAIREGLKTLMDWQEIGFHVVDTAANGREALKKFNEHQPELMIIDIHMPGISGVDVIRTIRESSVEPFHFLILNDYDDEYTRQELGFSVDGYLWKPLDEEEMIGELQRIRQVIKEEKEAESRGSESDLVESLLQGSPLSGEVPPELDWSTYQVMLLDLNISEYDKQAKQDAARQHLTSICEQRGEVLFLAGAFTGILLSQNIELQGREKELLEELKQELIPWAADVYAAAGRSVHDLNEISHSFTDALRLLERRCFFRQGRIMLSRDLIEMDQIQQHTGSNNKYTVLKQMVEFIRGHYHENLKLEMLADMFSYNSGYLGKLFKSYTGEPFNAYLDKVRIEHSIKLLVQGMKVYQVAERVGYANADYFHAKFKKYVGTSPSSYKSRAHS